MERRNIIIIGAALVLGVLAVYLTNAYFSGVEAEQERIAEEQQLVRVAVASQDLPFGAPLTPDTVRLVNWPAQSVPAGAFNDLNGLAGSNVAIRPIAAGEPILRSRISARAILSENIPDDMRATTIPVNDVAGVAGFVTPGDVVDVMMTREIPGGDDDLVTSVVLENAQVLAIDRRASEDSTEPQELKMATLLTNQYDAQRLALAAQSGRLTLALRNVENQNVGSAQVVTTRDLPGGRLRYASRNSTARPAPAPAPRQQVAYRPAPASAGTSQPSAPVFSGPTMTIYRGTDGARQEVSRGTN
ncbi:Flp pilus assembly protein CpaB [Qipengyuania sp. G39]|uniref:Flp pilus assembly protein CpaB n=1 Tax=Qipengyuania profundimaris TaxID=3067652 RepID=A0ABT9HK53_9SPHN|nr:Flp pilus assembly protein CpaB [Qipengyuania sp. G39]MDP4573529.1 Flp pilus assembly protein CpaB [Qipengyuania sp. G39]